METKYLSDWEVEKGVLFFDREKHPVDLELTEAEFDTRCDPETYTGIPDEGIEDLIAAGKEWTKINHAIRIGFLTSNDYPLTHENMYDISLSAKPLEQ